MIKWEISHFLTMFSTFTMFYQQSFSHNVFLNLTNVLSYDVIKWEISHFLKMFSTLTLFFQRQVILVWEVVFVEVIFVREVVFGGWIIFIREIVFLGQVILVKKSILSFLEDKLFLQEKLFSFKEKASCFRYVSWVYSTYLYAFSLCHSLIFLFRDNKYKITITKC